MNGNVTRRTSLILLRLVMERGRRRSSGIHSQGVAFKTEKIDLAAPQQSWIGGSVRRMTCDTTLRLHGSVLESERSRFVGMAVEAHLVLRCRGTKLIGQETTVLVMAV